MKRHVPKYRHYRPKNLGFAEHKRHRTYFPGHYQSRESVAAYQAFLGKILDERATATTPPPLGSLAVVELVDRYLAWAAEYYGRTSEYGCQYTACQPLILLYGTTAVQDFGPIALAKVRDAMILGSIPDAWKVARRWNRTHINHQVGRIRQAFRWGVSQELVPPAVADALRSLPGLRKGKSAALEPRRILPVPPAIIEATVSKMPPVVADMVRLQALTGMRSGNLCSIRPADIDRARPVWRYVPAKHKTAWRGTELVVFLGPKAQEILAPYLGRSPEAYCFSPIEAFEQRSQARRAARKSPVSPAHANRRAEHRARPLTTRYSTASYRKAIRYACRKAGVTFWHPHRLRHSAATLVRDRFGVEAAQVVLGHSRADVTQVYAERSFGLAEKIVLEIG